MWLDKLHACALNTAAGGGSKTDMEGRFERLLKVVRMTYIKNP